MQASDIPTIKFAIPFANSAGGSYIRAIPQASQIGITNGAASLTDGFPPLNFLPVGSGGVPPFGQDMNGILFEMSGWTRWQNSGGSIPYDSAFQTSIGGYPQGCIVASATTLGLFWFSTVDDNTTNPDTGGAGWLPFQPAQQGVKWRNMVLIASTATFNPATYGLTANDKIMPLLWGGGAGSSPDAGTPAGGAAGSGGGFSMGIFSCPATSFTITVGPGGVGHNGGTAGGQGGTTSITALGISASGAASTGAGSGTPGFGSGGLVNLSGSPGGDLAGDGVRVWAAGGAAPFMAGQALVGGSGGAQAAPIGSGGACGSGIAQDGAAGAVIMIF